MGLQLRGRIASAGTGRGVSGARVEVSLPVQGDAREVRSVITGLDGRFSVRFTDRDLGDGAQPETAALRVLAADGSELRGASDTDVRQLAGRGLEVPLGDDVLGDAALPPQPAGVPVLSGEAVERIRAAIARAAPAAEAPAHLAALDAACARLPALLTSSALATAAEGALLGRGADIALFDVLLRGLELSGPALGPTGFQGSERDEAERLLSSETLGAAAEHARAAGTPARLSAIEKRAAISVLGAALRVAGSDPVRIARNVRSVLGQIALADEVSVLSDLASLTLAGHEAARTAFLARLREQPALSGGFRRPVSFPPLPGIRGWPRPDAPERPPRLPDLPFGAPRFWGRFGECLDIEVVRGLREVLERTHTFTITSIEPPHACPGHVVTIRGSGFLFEGRTGTVGFPGPEPGTVVPSEPPLKWTDDEIQVAVPAGAACGRLELDVPGASDSAWICDYERDLFPASRSSVTFSGGATSIVSFHVSSSSACAGPGETVHLDWRLCNVDDLRLEVRRHDFVLVESLTLDPSTNGMSFDLPADFEQNISLVFKLIATGPCGRDSEEERIAVHRGPVDPATDPFVPGEFINFGKNIFKRGLRMASPKTLAELVNAIDHAEAAGGLVGIRGGSCSYTDIVAPDPGAPLGSAHLIDTDLLAATPFDADVPPALAVIPFALRRGLDDTDSVMSADVLAAYAGFVTVSPLRDRLVQVEGGIRLVKLLCQLGGIREGAGLTMPALGGGARHSLTGAVSTGTHGSTTRLPPIADFVRAIHLVGTGGQQWWLEPAARPITDPEKLEQLKRSGRLDPCLNVRYSDDLFHAALVSFGTAGVIYSVVVETIDSHRFAGSTVARPWEDVQASIRDRVLAPETPLDWHFDVTMDPLGRARESRLALTSEPFREDTSHRPLAEILIGWLVKLPVQIALGLPLYIAQQALRMLNPFNIPQVLRETVELIAELTALLVDLVAGVGALVAAAASGSTRPLTTWLVDFLPNALNLMWRLPVAGRATIDELQVLLTDTQVPLGTFVRRDFLALTFESETPCLDTSVPRNFSDVMELERLIKGYEYVVPAERGIALANAIMAVANEVREGPGALVLIINLRFTRETRALLGMQQFERSCHVELFTVKGLNGNRAFDARLQPVLDGFGAIPHWGLLHDASTDYAARFGARLDAWRRAIGRLNRGLRTFRHGLAVARGLLE